jgi:hypothetical protein
MLNLNLETEMKELHIIEINSSNKKDVVNQLTRKYGKAFKKDIKNAIDSYLKNEQFINEE